MDSAHLELKSHTGDKSLKPAHRGTWFTTIHDVNVILCTVRVKVRNRDFYIIYMICITCNVADTVLMLLRNNHV